MEWLCNNTNCVMFGENVRTWEEYACCSSCGEMQEPAFVYCTKIVEAYIPEVGLREIGRIYEVPGRGTFYTITKEVQPPAGKVQNYGINCNYLMRADRGE